MTDHNSQDVEAILTKYRPAEAPADLLYRVEQAAMRSRKDWHESFTTALSSAAEIVLGLAVRGLVTAATVIVLLLISMKGY
jgi:hypothetical protein